MKKFGLIIIIIILLMGCSNNQLPDEQEEQSTDLRIGYLNYPSSYAQALLLQGITERKGYSTEIVLRDNSTMWKELASGSIHTYLTAWLPGINASELLEIQKSITDLGMNSSGSSTGLYVPDYTNIAYVFELNFYKQRFGRTIYVCEESEGVNKATQAVINALNADIKIEKVPYKEIDQLLSEARKNKEWIVLALWSPNSKVDKYDLRRLNELNSMFGLSYETHTIVHNDMQDEKILHILDNYYIYQWEINNLLNVIETANVAKEGSEKEIISAWLDNNPQVMKRVE